MDLVIVMQVMQEINVNIQIVKRNGSGIVHNNGSCNCNTGYAGNKCHYFIVKRNGNGIVQNNGSCNCNMVSEINVNIQIV